MSARVKLMLCEGNDKALLNHWQLFRVLSVMIVMAIMIMIAIMIVMMIVFPNPEICMRQKRPRTRLCSCIDLHALIEQHQTGRSAAPCDFVPMVRSSAETACALGRNRQADPNDTDLNIALLTQHPFVTFSKTKKTPNKRM